MSLHRVDAEGGDMKIGEIYMSGEAVADLAKAIKVMAGDKAIRLELHKTEKGFFKLCVTEEGGFIDLVAHPV